MNQQHQKKTKTKNASKTTSMTIKDKTQSCVEIKETEELRWRAVNDDLCADGVLSHSLCHVRGPGPDLCHDRGLCLDAHAPCTCSPQRWFFVKSRPHPAHTANRVHTRSSFQNSQTFHTFPDIFTKIQRSTHAFTLKDIGRRNSVWNGERYSWGPKHQYSFTHFVPQMSSEHFDEDSRDYLPSNSHENQSEDDSESTDGFKWFTDQVHLSTSRQWLCLSYVTSGVVFSPIDWNNFYYKTSDHYTLFCLKTWETNT